MKKYWMAALAFALAAVGAAAQADAPMAAHRGAYLGVGVVDISHERALSLKLREDSGVEITLVDRDAPAGKAGVREHDVLLTYNGVKVESDAQLRRLVRETPAGRSVSLSLLRDGQTLNVNVKLADRRELSEAMGPRRNHDLRRGSAPQRPPFGQGFFGREGVMRAPGDDMRFPLTARAGLIIEGLTPQLAEFFGLSNGLAGVLVRDVAKDGPAAAAGVKAGDVILEANKKKTAEPGALAHVIHEGGDVVLRVLRDKKELTLTLKLPERRRAAIDGEESATLPDPEELENEFEELHSQMDSTFAMAHCMPMAPPIFLRQAPEPPPQPRPEEESF